MKEWYLTTPKPNIVSGYESDAISEYSQSNFTDVLETLFSDTVLLYNNTLTESKEIRCVIQGNSADTQLKSMERVGLFPIGTVKAGMYIFFENKYWLITGYPSNNKSYEKAVMQLCQYKLRWQNAKGEIIERYISLSSASKYDIGETGNSTIVLTSDNLTLLFPNDEESLNVYGKRVFIDKRTPPEKVYKITRSDDVLYDFGEHGGVLAFIADKTELNTTTDRQDLGICDYIEVSDDTEEPSDPTTPPENPDEMTDLRVVISGNKNLKVGFSHTYTATITDVDGNAAEWNNTYSWNVTSDFKVGQVIDSNKIELLVEDEDYIDSLILLQAIRNNTVVAEIEITVIEMW
jgi:hypothetical protein